MADDDRDYVLYARVNQRVKAMIIDYFIVLGTGVLLAVIGSHIAGAGPVAFVLAAAFFLLYDPLMVWRTSGTVGHHLLNLRVVSDKTGGNPSLLAALVRNVSKGVLGVVSLLAMAGSER